LASLRNSPVHLSAMLMGVTRAHVHFEISMRISAITYDAYHVPLSYK